MLLGGVSRVFHFDWAVLYDILISRVGEGTGRGPKWPRPWLWTSAKAWPWMPGLYSVSLVISLCRGIKGMWSPSHLDPPRNELAGWVSDRNARKPRWGPAMTSSLLRITFQEILSIFIQAFHCAVKWCGRVDWIQIGSMYVCVCVCVRARISHIRVTQTSPGYSRLACFG